MGSETVGTVGRVAERERATEAGGGLLDGRLQVELASDKFGLDGAGGKPRPELDVGSSRDGGGGGRCGGGVRSGDALDDRVADLGNATRGTVDGNGIVGNDRIEPRASDADDLTSSSAADRGRHRCDCGLDNHIDVAAGGTGLAEGDVDFLGTSGNEGRHRAGKVGCLQGAVTQGAALAITKANLEVVVVGAGVTQDELVTVDGHGFRCGNDLWTDFLHRRRGVFGEAECAASWILAVGLMSGDDEGQRLITSLVEGLGLTDNLVFTTVVGDAITHCDGTPLTNVDEVVLIARTEAHSSEGDFGTAKDTASFWRDLVDDWGLLLRHCNAYERADDNSGAEFFNGHSGAQGFFNQM